MFIQISEPHLDYFLDLNKATISSNVFIDRLRAVSHKHDTYLFTNVPGVNGPAWTEDMQKSFAIDFPNDRVSDRHVWNDWLCIPMKDKVMSGFSI
jgi:hypothetical protein